MYKAATATLLCLLLQPGCRSPSLRSVDWAAYKAVHLTHFSARGDDPLLGGQWERETDRRERYSERLLDVGVERIYRQHEIVERITVDGEPTTTRIRSPLEGRPILILEDGNAWVPSDSAGRSVVGDLTQFGPPRLVATTGGEFTLDNRPLLHFLHQGAFVSGSLDVERLGVRRVGVEVEERYAQATVTGRGWVLYDIGTGIVQRMELSGEIRRPDRTEEYRTTREWVVDRS